MNVEIYDLTRQNEQLRNSLQSAIDYLRLLPRVPVTLSKIRDLEQALQEASRSSAREYAESSEVNFTLFTPVGQKIELALQGDRFVFFSDIPLDGVDFPINREALDKLIEALIAKRLAA